MPETQNHQWLKLNEGYLETWLEAFLVDRKAQNLASGTLYFYIKKLALFGRYCEGQAINAVEQVTPDVLRRYLFWLEETGHNPGGIHDCYRALKTFLLWYEDEVEPPDWRNPIRRVKAPRLPTGPLTPVSLEDVSKLLDTCGSDFHGLRDRAILLTLLDTGARASELCGMDVTDMNLITGAVAVRHGKGNKARMVYLGRVARKATRRYLRARSDRNAALWTSTAGDRLTYWGLDQMLKRRAHEARIRKPQLHSFRRAFALNMLRNGADIFSLQLLMGHADLQVLRRYLAQSEHDIQTAHTKAGPVDRALR